MGLFLWIRNSNGAYKRMSLLKFDQLQKGGKDGVRKDDGRSPKST